MAVTILSRTISSVLDKKLVLSNSQWAAKLSIGTSWNEIRIGLRYAMTDGAALLPGPPRLYLGMLSSPASGLTNGPLGSSCSHWVGTVSNVGVAFARTTAPVKYEYLPFIAKKVGSTLTTGASYFSHFISADPGTVRSAVIVRILKGSPNFTVGFCGADLAAGVVDCSLSALKTAMVVATFTDSDESLETSLGLGATAFSSSNTTLAVDESTNGSLDSICVAWDRFSNSIEFSEILFAKIS